MSPLHPLLTVPPLHVPSRHSRDRVNPQTLSPFVLNKAAIQHTCTACNSLATTRYYGEHRDELKMRAVISHYDNCRNCQVIQKAWRDYLKRSEAAKRAYAEEVKEINWKRRSIVIKQGKRLRALGGSKFAKTLVKRNAKAHKTETPETGNRDQMEETPNGGATEGSRGTTSAPNFPESELK